MARILSSGRCANSGCWGSSMREMMERSIRASSLAYGRAAIAASCARRSRAAATNFIARVICWVFLTERMRRRKSRSVAIAVYRGMLLTRCLCCGRGHEWFLERINRLAQLDAQGIIQRFLFCNLFEQPTVIGVHEIEQFALEAAALGGRNIVHRPAGSREDHKHLLLNRQRRVLILLEHFGQPLATRQLCLRYLVELLGAELRECREVPELRHVQTQ